jgi:acyl-CoA thioesterase-1
VNDLMRRLLVLATLAIGIACGRETAAPKAPDPAPASASAPSTAPDSELRRDKQSLSPRIVFLGDSLTAGLGLPDGRSYPALIGKKLKDRGHPHEVVNAGVSGDTSAGGARRLDWSLEGDVRVLVLALGANDGLRGLPTEDLKKNLKVVLDRATTRGIPVILAGMEAPPNNGADYTRAFRGVYVDLAKEYRVRFIPFLLQGVAGDPSLNQADGIHPNIRGAEIVADLVWAELEPLLGRPTDHGSSPKPSASAKATADKQAPSPK